MPNKIFFIVCLLLLVACSDKQGKEVKEGKDSKTKTEVTYQAEPNSPWGSFTMPVKEATYALQAPASQQDESLVQWKIKVYCAEEDLFINADKMTYPEGTIRSYNSSRKTFKVSARDSAVYLFTVSNTDWIVRTNINYQ